jgi:tRNA dimethylallyltransferase
MSSSVVSAGASSQGGAGESRPLVVPVICGPTAAGKTAVAMWLAQRYSLLVISADSRQIYRGFDVGTAKPSAEDRLRVPHRGIDVVNPGQRYSAAEWATLAQRAIGEAHAAGRVPVIVGGTGFYIAALFRPLWVQPPLEPQRRVEIQQALEPMSTDELRRWCQTLDPARAHLGRTQLVRAIEVALLTGERLSDLHVARSRPAAYMPSYLLVDPGPALASRIARRTQVMLDGGWPDEVRQHMESLPADVPAWRATGYEVVRDLVRGQLAPEVATERIVIETRQYAKRQRTWFRHQLERDQVRRLAPDESSGAWQDDAERWFRGVERSRESGASL